MAALQDVSRPGAQSDWQEPLSTAVQPWFDHVSRPRASWVLPQVLDEADRLLEPSFEAELAAVLGTLPEERQTLLFRCDQAAGAAPSAPPDGRRAMLARLA